MPSILQPWVALLGLREQGTLLTAVRGCDLTPKYPLDSSERRIVSCIRGAFLVPADPREVDSVPGCFMSTQVPDVKWSAFGHYPQHWVAHILHAIEVLGFRHPDEDARRAWRTLYLQGCGSFHLRPEALHDFEYRMNEDRIANNTIVG